MKSFAVLGLATDELDSFIGGTHADPFRILGPHRVGDDLAVRVFRPDVREVAIVLSSGEEIAAQKLHRDGFFEAILPGQNRHCDYRIRAVKWDGSERSLRDPYCYGTIMGEIDLHLFAEGQHWELYKKFGAHLRSIG